MTPRRDWRVRSFQPLPPYFIVGTRMTWQLQLCCRALASPWLGEPLSGVSRFRPSPPDPRLPGLEGRPSLVPALSPRRRRRAASRAIFSSRASSRRPAPSPSPLKCLQAGSRAGSPLPHGTTSVTALTTGRSGLDLLKKPGGGAGPAPAAQPADGWGRVSAGGSAEREGERQRAKSRSPPHPHPGPPLPSPPLPRATAGHRRGPCAQHRLRARPPSGAQGASLRTF